MQPRPFQTPPLNLASRVPNSGSQSRHETRASSRAETNSRKVRAPPPPYPLVHAQNRELLQVVTHFRHGTRHAEHFTKMPQASPTSVPQVRTPSVITRLVELREAADFLARDRNRLPAATLEETRNLIETAFNLFPQIHDGNDMVIGKVAQAETFALRELAAARRHHDLASRNVETCRAACELSLRALTRAIDSILTELLPHSMVPSI